MSSESSTASPSSRSISGPTAGMGGGGGARRDAGGGGGGGGAPRPGGEGGFGGAPPGLIDGSGGGGRPGPPERIGAGGAVREGATPRPAGVGGLAGSGFAGGDFSLAFAFSGGCSSSTGTWGGAGCAGSTASATPDCWLGGGNSPPPSAAGPPTISWSGIVLSSNFGDAASRSSVRCMKAVLGNAGGSSSTGSTIRVAGSGSFLATAGSGSFLAIAGSGSFLAT